MAANQLGYSLPSILREGAMLDRFHKISEIIAAFAIVGSLVFVGIQLNQNTSALLVDSQQSAMAAWNDTSLAIATNERLAGLISESRYPEFKAAEAGGSESRQALTFITASMNTKALVQSMKMNSCCKIRRCVKFLISSCAHRNYFLKKTSR